jgi:molybdate transport system substrate-binding protein
VNVVATYPIATVKQTRNARAALAFIAFVLSSEGQQLLAAAGFDPAP